jgi:hypothetical protein
MKRAFPRSILLHLLTTGYGTFRSLATLDHYSRFRETSRHI